MPFSGLQLSLPPPIIGLAGRYPANSLIGRSPILKRTRSNSRAIWAIKHSSIYDLSGVDVSFPTLSPSLGQVDYVLLSRTPSLQVKGLTCMA